MKVLFVSSLYPPYRVGGAEQGLEALAVAMAIQGDEVHIAALAEPGGPAVSTEQAGDVTVHRFALANVYWPWDKSDARSSLQKSVWHLIDSANPKMASHLGALISRLQPDVVVTGNLQGWSTAVVPAAKRHDVPVVHVLNDYSLLCPQTTLFRDGTGCGAGRNRCQPCRLLTRPRHMHMRDVDAVVGVSQSVLDFHIAHGLFADSRQAVIHNPLKIGIDIAAAPVVHNDGPVRFGYLGRVEPMKGIETLLRAVDSLSQENLPMQILIAGNAASDDYLSSLKQRWPMTNVEYLGYVDDTTALLDRIDCLVFPTDWLEALGNGVFEAFARGVPVIGSDAGGIPESIDDAQNGFVFRKGNWRQLAAHMKTLTVDVATREHMSHAALAKAPGYLASQRAKQYREFLDTVVQDYCRTDRFESLRCRP